MARFPGTETHGNRAGLRPGATVRCRRSQANAVLGFDDRRGVVAEVRLGHARLLFGLDGESAWIANEQLLAEPVPEGELAMLARVLELLRAERVDVEDGDLVIAGGEYDVEALDAVRARLGPRLLGASVRPEGVHLVATRLRLAPG